MTYIKSFLLECKSKFLSLSIYTKLLLSFSSIILFFCIISIIDFNFYKNDKISNTLNTINQMNSQSLSEIDSYINDVEKITEMPLFEQNPNLIKKLSESNKDANIFFNIDTDVNFMFNAIFSLKNDIHSVFLFNLNGQSNYRISGSSLYSDYYPSNEKWFKDTIDNFGKPILVPSYKLEYMADKPSGLNYFFSISRAIVDYDTSSVVGIITINSNINIIKNFLQKLLIYDNQRIILVDAYNNIIYDTHEDNISNPLSSTDVGLAITNVNDKSVRINNEQCVAKITSSDNTGWKLINIIPSNSINKQLTNLKRNTIILISFFIVLALIFVNILSKQIVHPLYRLSRKMELVEKGDLDISLDISTHDEVGRLSESFNTMLTKLRNLINEVYVDKIKQKETEIKMLQNQINPHFLYNTLESIHMMAEINDDPEVSKMSVSLGSILRYGLSTHINIVSLKDELNNITLYMDLQKNRLDNIDDIYFEVPNELLNAKVIKLILQPIVENSIYHGLSSIASGGLITVKAYAEEEQTLVIDIIDNGTGMASSTLEKLNGYINGFNDDFNSIGLKNVNMRINLHYGIGYGLTIFSNGKTGTLVKIKLPLSENQK